MTISCYKLNIYELEDLVSFILPKAESADVSTIGKSSSSQAGDEVTEVDTPNLPTIALDGRSVRKGKGKSRKDSDSSSTKSKGSIRRTLNNQVSSSNKSCLQVIHNFIP